MPSLSRAIVLLLAGVGLTVAGVTPALAAETSNSEIVIVREDDVVDDDLYAGAISIRVIGLIDGDLIAFAAEQVVIDGRVTGSVTVISPRVVVNGVVDGSLRVVANDVVVNGSVGSDLVTAAVDVRFGPDSSVEGEVLAWVNEMTALGSIGRSLSGTQRMLDLAGSVEGSVDVSVTRLRVVGPLTVGGDLRYRSGRVAEGMDKATVSGTVVQRTSLPPNLRVRALGVFARFLAVLFLTIAAVTTVWGWPDRTARAADVVGVAPWKGWLIGAGIFLSPLLLAIAAGLVISRAPPAAGLPLLALVVPLFLALLGLLMVVSLAAGVPVAARLGRLVFKRMGIYGSTLAGSLILGLLWLLPAVGWLVPVVAMPLGLGSWILTRRRQEEAGRSSSASS
jgi:hypothetical protein